MPGFYIAGNQSPSRTTIADGGISNSSRHLSDVQGNVPCGRPSLQSPPPAKKFRVHPSPQLDVRYHNIGHLPTSQEKKDDADTA